MTRRREVIFEFVLAGIFCSFTGCSSNTALSQDASPGIVIPQQRMDALHDELAAAVTSAAANVMNQPGIVGALGGAHVKLISTGNHEISLPLPQLADGQIPICFYIRSTPSSAAIEYRLKIRDHSNVFLSVRLKGDRNQEVQFDWSAVVLVAGTAVQKNDANLDSYRKSSACVQSGSKEIQKLADELWPQNKDVKDYAANIQRFISEMKQKKRPRSLDALGILDSGTNGICTANANLALALLREKGIASRSMAVIPPISHRLEMHRIVEYAAGQHWIPFDPSSLSTEVPMQPWQSVIMCKTTIADENLGGKPRMGSSVGVPYGQEIELITRGVTLSGQDFFWSIAKPLAEFQPTDAVITMATEAWKRYLETGELSPGQIAASTVSTSEDLLKALKSQ